MDLIIDKMKALKLEKLEWFKDDTERAVSYIMNIQKIAKTGRVMNFMKKSYCF